MEGVWHNFNEVVEEGGFLPVFTPVLSDIEKKSWYDNVVNEKEVVIIAEHPNLKSPYNILGQCEISNPEWEGAMHVGVLGIIINEKYRDMGLGEQMIDLAIRESKNLNNKEKIVLSCFSSNERAIYLYKKMGFEIVGIRIKQFYTNSVYYDEVLMDLWIDDYLNNEK